MSTPRFPRSKFVRRLLAMEVELMSWARYLCQLNVEAGVRTDVNGWDERATAMWAAAVDMHSLADDMHHLPGAAERRYRRDLAQRDRAALPRTRIHRREVSPETVR